MRKYPINVNSNEGKIDWLENQLAVYKNALLKLLPKEIKVFFKGIPPDLFREGQGVIAEGSVGDDYTFTASSILAKHDENYMPPEVEKILKKEGFYFKTSRFLNFNSHAHLVIMISFC